jgi:hypothetical protein
LASGEPKDPDLLASMKGDAVERCDANARCTPTRADLAPMKGDAVERCDRVPSLPRMTCVFLEGCEDSRAEWRLSDGYWCSDGPTLL